MASHHRVSRLNEQLKREITDVIRHGVRDPRIGMVTVTDVSTTTDLEHARVFVTMLGDAEALESTLAGLRAAAPFIRGELGRRLRIRQTPELRFEVDASLEHARRIEELLRTVRPATGDAPPDPADDATRGTDAEKGNGDVA